MIDIAFDSRSSGLFVLSIGCTNTATNVVVLTRATYCANQPNKTTDIPRRNAGRRRLDSRQRAARAQQNHRAGKHSDV